MNKKRVLIVGGGISGLTMAVLLERQGIRPVIAEKASNWERSGFGITIMPPGFRALRELGLDDEIREAGTTPRHAEFRSANGTVFTSVGIGMAGVDCITLPRERLQKKLLSLLKSSEIHLGTTVKSIREEPEGIIVCLNDRTEAAFDLVVGADGVNSGIRQLIFPEYKPKYIGAAIWTFYWPLPHSPPNPNVTTFVSGCSQFMGIFPFHHTAIVSMCAMIHPSIQLRSINLHRYAKELSYLAPEILSKVDSGTIFSSHLRQVKLSAWHKGRVVLIGDAAHAMLPSTAMAVSMGLLDAVALAEEVMNYEPHDLSQAAANYEKKRKRTVTNIQREAYIAWKLFVLNKLPIRLKIIILQVIPFKLLITKLSKS